MKKHLLSVIIIIIAFCAFFYAQNWSRDSIRESRELIRQTAHAADCGRDTQCLKNPMPPGVINDLVKLDKLMAQVYSAENPKTKFEKILPEIKKMPSVSDVIISGPSVSVIIKNGGSVGFSNVLAPQPLRSKLN